MVEIERSSRGKWREEVPGYLCAVVFSFFPIVCVYLIQAYYGHYLSVTELLKNGGVLTISITLSAEALSRLVDRRSRWRELRLLAVSCSAWLIGCGSLFYGLRFLQEPPNPVFFTDLCLVLLVASLIVSTVSKFLPEDE